MDGNKWGTFAAISTGVVLIISLGFYSFYSVLLIQTNKEMRLGPELSLFTQTYLLSKKTAADFFQKYDDQIEAFLDGKAGMSKIMYGDLVQMLDDVEFLAWLLNNDYITLKGADKILYSQLEHVLDEAGAIIEKADPPASEYFAKYYPEITKLWVPNNKKTQKGFLPPLD